jgi:hypothetical protein
VIPLWAIKLGAISAAALALFSAGAYSHMRWAGAKAAKVALQASEDARKVERESAVSAIRKLDNFAAEQAANERRALAARSDLEQLRGSLAALASPAAPASCPVDGRLRGLADLLAEGAGLVEEGPRHVEELRNQRDALK